MQQLLWINGKHKNTQTLKALKSPYNQEVIAEIAQASSNEVEEAIESANEAAKK